MNKDAYYSSAIILFVIGLLLMIADILLWPFPHTVFHILGWAGLFELPFLVNEKYGKHISFAILVFVALMEILEHWAMYSFKMLFSGNLVFILSATNSEEIVQFLRMFGYWKVVLIFVGILLFFFSLWWVCYKLPSKITWLPLSPPKLIFRMSLSLGILLLFVLAHSPRILHNPQKAFFEQSCWLACTKGVAKASIEFRRMLGMMREPCFPKGLTLSDKGKQTPPLGVIIIGESSCRNYWSLYGYSRKTTPKLDSIQSELVVFNDLCGTATETSTGLLNLFVKRERLANGALSSSPFSDLLINACVRVSIISTQSNNKKYGDFQTVMFDSIKEKFYLSYEQKKENKDLSVLPYLENLLSRNTQEQPELIFVHTVGNHFPCTNYRKENDMFTYCSDKETIDLDNVQRAAINAYCNTMLHVDETIFCIIDMVRAKAGKRPAFVLFVSDHGETPREPWRRANSRDLWELPLVIWFNDDYKSSFHEIYRQAMNNAGIALTSDRLYWGMCSLMQLTFDGFPYSEDFLSEQYSVPAQRRVYRGQYIYDKNSAERFLHE